MCKCVCTNKPAKQHNVRFIISAYIKMVEEVYVEKLGRNPYDSPIVSQTHAWVEKGFEKRDYLGGRMFR